MGVPHDGMEGNAAELAVHTSKGFVSYRSLARKTSEKGEGNP